MTQNIPAALEALKRTALIIDDVVNNDEKLRANSYRQFMRIKEQTQIALSALQSHAEAAGPVEYAIVPGTREAVIQIVEDQMGYYDMPELEPSIAFTGGTICDLVDLAKTLMSENDDLEEACALRQLEIYALKKPQPQEQSAGDCTKCNGHGQIVRAVSSDAARNFKCDHCDGKGKQPPAAQAVDLEKLKRELNELFVPYFNDGNAVLRDRANTDGYMQHTSEIINYLATHNRLKNDEGSDEETD